MKSSNVRTFISPFEIITGSVYGNASQYYKPVFVTGYNPEDPDEISVSKNRFFATGGEFSEVAGKGKLCKAAGLTGAEKKACTQNIKSKCGKKPFCVGLVSRNCKAKKAKWETCASSQVVSPEQAAQDAAEKLVPDTADSGMGIGVKLMIGAAALGTIALIGFAISNRMKAKQLTPAIK